MTPALPHPEQLAHYQKELESFFQSYFTGEKASEALEDAMAYSLLQGGKRLRPVLTLAFCALFGGKVESALPFALAVEMIHSYSLIHDDLPAMDNDDLRRGKPSCHIQFGEATAILAGDSLLTSAFYALTTAELPPSVILEAVAHLSVSAGEKGMAGGQALELSFQDRCPELEELLHIQQLKTGSLLASACYLGAIAGGAEGDDLNKVLSFATYLGSAFQIRDDILDAVGNQEQLGKPIGSDEKEGRTTFYTLLGEDVAQDRVRFLTQKGIQALDGFRNTEFLLWLAEDLTMRKQ